MKGRKTIQISITIAATAILITHILFPALMIDAISIVLFVIIILPWLAPLFKSIELPGGLKVEFSDLEKASQQAAEAGLIDKSDLTYTPSSNLQSKYTFVDVAATDQTLGLAGLRLEIEKSLKLLAQKYKITEKHAGVSRLINVLANNGVLTRPESQALLDIVQTLNQAVHGVDYDPRTADWVIKNGPPLLESINSKL